MHIDDLAIRRWLQRRKEATENRLQLSREEQLRILTRLTDASHLRGIPATKNLSARKPFSLDGSESLIPLLGIWPSKRRAKRASRKLCSPWPIADASTCWPISSAKTPARFSREFADIDPHLYTGRGDVKYHLGHSSEWQTAAGRKIHLSLCFNPSHLEFVNPVALGRVRAKQDRAGDSARERTLTLLIHGDAAFAGEGIIQETLNLSQLPGYTVGGALHIILNNQIGFTTPPREGRSK